MTEVRKRCRQCLNWKQRTEDNYKKKRLKGWASVCRVCRSNRKKGAS